MHFSFALVKISIILLVLFACLINVEAPGESISSLHNLLAYRVQ